MEGDNVKDFFEAWLPKILHLTVKNDWIKVDRFNRSPAQPHLGINRPRVINISLHNYLDKQLIMQSTHNLGEILVSGSRIHLCGDFSPVLEKKCQGYTEV
ncbi:hypothetical protein CHARACLAT_002893 [Characodon lateralis]|uniref:Uncharacterized protein n=1 Tax=Characodon lateralis TaxID=208331 RepID=A0ABU7DDH9_9TELE|nr:hypothetical protein [Characodon lateralis]